MSHVATCSSFSKWEFGEFGTREQTCIRDIRSQKHATPSSNSSNCRVLMYFTVLTAVKVRHRRLVQMKREKVSASCLKCCKWLSDQSSKCYYYEVVRKPLRAVFFVRDLLTVISNHEMILWYKLVHNSSTSSFIDCTYFGIILKYDSALPIGLRIRL